MAEIIGAVSGTVTLCALLGTCLDAFDAIKEGRSFDFTIRKLLVRLNIERVRLYAWAKSVGIADPPKIGRSDRISHETVVRDALQIITDLLLDSGKIQSRYGCVEADLADTIDDEAAAQGPVGHLRAPFSNLAIAAGPTATHKGKGLLSKARWVIRDKDKFEGLILEVKSYVDGIYSITEAVSAIEVAERSTRDGLYKIDDVETLEMVSVACQADYPSFSDTASIKVEVMSQSSSRRNEISSWIGRLSSETASDAMIQVPTLSPERTRATNHDPVLKLTQEAKLSIETLISPLTEEEMKGVDDVILKYLDYRNLTRTAKAFRSEIYGGVSGEAVKSQGVGPPNDLVNQVMYRQIKLYCRRRKRGGTAGFCFPRTAPPPWQS